MRRVLSPLISIFFLFSVFCHAQQLWTGIIDPSRAVNWSNAGVSGGIPARTTICQSVSLTTGSSAAAANTTAIQNAITACSGTNATVSLPSGTYYFNGFDFPSGTNNVTVRGQGANSTFLIASGTTSCAVPSDICWNGPNNSVGGEQNVCEWTAGYTAGTTVITGGTCSRGALSNLKVGAQLMLDQTDEAADTGTMWNCSSNGQGGDAVCANTTQGGWARMDGTAGANGVTIRGQSQTVTVTNISGSNVTVSPGLYLNNWRSSQAPEMWFGSSLGPTGDGVEDISVDNSAMSTGGYIFQFFNSSQDWVSGVRGLYGGRDHVQVQYSSHITIQHSYFYQSLSHNTVSYTVEENDASDNLTQNIICQQVTDSCPNNNGAAEGNVAIFNFGIDDVYNAAGWFQGTAYQHTSGDALNLWEGSIYSGYTSDDVHGTHHLETLFRNYLQGNQNAGCGSAGVNICTAQTTPVNLYAASRYNNVIGNVLGRPGYHTHYQYNGSSIGSGNPAVTSIYVLGATGNSGDVSGGQSAFCATPSCSATGPYDPQTWNYLMRWGNYDVATGGVRWCGSSSDTGWSTSCGSTSEIPTSLPTCTVCNGAVTFSNAVPTLGDTGAGQSAMPASFYYSSKPSWFGSTPWPPIGPDVTGGNLGLCSGGTYANMPAVSSSQCTGGTLVAAYGGHVNANPAMACYLNVMGGPPDGSGNALDFNADSCYGTASPPPAPPTGLAAVVQ